MPCPRISSFPRQYNQLRRSLVLLAWECLNCDVCLSQFLIFQLSFLNTLIEACICTVRELMPESFGAFGILETKRVALDLSSDSLLEI